MKLMNERLDDLRRELARETQDRTAKEAIKACDGCCCIAGQLEKDAAKRLEQAWKSINLSNVPTCSKRNWANFGSRTMGVKPGPSCANGRESHRQRNPSTPGHGKNPPPPRQGNPELLPHRFDQRKDKNQSQDSRFARQRLCFRDDDFLKLRLYALHEAKFTFVG